MALRSFFFASSRGPNRIAVDAQKMNIRALTFVLLAALLVNGTTAAQALRLEPVWQRSHAPAGHSLESRASITVADGAVAVLGLQRPIARGKDRTEDKGWIGVFGDDGVVRHEIAFVMRPGDSALKEVDAFVPSPPNEFVVAGQAMGGESWLVAVDLNGKVRPIRPLGNKRISVVLRLDSGDLVLGGRDGRDLYASRLRADGGLVWERKLDRGFDELFLAGAPTSEGVVMLEHSGMREQFFMRDAVLGLTMLREGRDSIGAPGFSMPGRAGAFVAAGNGYGVLVDTGVGVQQSLKFVRLDEGLRRTAEVDVLSIQFGLERSRLARPRTGGYLVTALDGSRLICLWLDERGMTTGRFESPADRVFLHPDAVAASAAFAVATELVENTSQPGTRMMVYLAKFLPNR